MILQLRYVEITSVLVFGVRVPGSYPHSKIEQTTRENFTTNKDMCWRSIPHVSKVAYLRQDSANAGGQAYLETSG